MVVRRRAAVVAAALLAVALAACSKAAPEAGPGPASTPPADREYVTVTHLLVKFATPKQTNVRRSKAEAKRIADSLLLDVQGGRSFDDMVVLFSEDKDPKTDKVNTLDTRTRQPTDKPGRYVFTHGEMVKPFEDAAFAAPVGKMVPTPVETEYGYHLIRRDA